MVRALLAGTKTQTRRVVRKQFAPDAMAAEVPATTPEGWQVSGHSGLWWDDAGACLDDAVRCPYGQPGDRLWVRETYFAWGRWETRFSAKKGRDEWHFVDMTLECVKAYKFDADGWTPEPYGGRRKSSITPAWWKRPTIFMPRAASRITLESTEVRAVRLQDISIEDAKAEGAWGPDESIVDKVAKYFGTDLFSANPRRAFQMLWEQINGAESWAANPWVWVVEFKRVEPA